MPQYTIKLRDLLDEFKGIDPNTDIGFGNANLSFKRTKWRGENLIVIEFNERTWPLDDDESNAEYSAYLKQ